MEVVGIIFTDFAVTVLLNNLWVLLLEGLDWDTGLELLVDVWVVSLEHLILSSEVHETMSTISGIETFVKGIS